VQATSVTKGGSSAWNTAGTYEERILTPWASQHLIEKLGAIHFAGNGASVMVTGVKVGDGGLAQVTMIRGKKKAMADFSIDALEFTLTENGPSTAEGGGFKLEGSMRIDDITADKEYEIGIISISKLDGQPVSSESALTLANPTIKGLYDALVKKASKAHGCSTPCEEGTLQDCIHNVLIAFCNELAGK